MRTLRPTDTATASRLRGALLGLGALALAACGGPDPGGTYEIEPARQVRELPDYDGRFVLSSQRFGRAGHARADHAHEAETPRRNPLAWDLPAGWTELPPTRMRFGNFGVSGRPDVECALSIIPGRGGGMAANVNRWRGQMGLDRVDDAALAALPKTLILGIPAVVVELEGTYGGMRGDLNLADWKMVGLIADVGGTALFVKMTGPREDVDAERAAYDGLVASIRRADQEPEGRGGDAPTALEWDAPEGWELGKGGSWRLVTYHAGEDSEVECYVTSLVGTGGGVAANVDLWHSQMGRPSLRPDEIAALPTVAILGRNAPLVEITGSYTGKDGKPVDDAMMLGAICLLEDRALFFRMLGPADAVRAERERFLAFCESVR